MPRKRRQPEPPKAEDPADPESPAEDQREAAEDAELEAARERLAAEEDGQPEEQPINADTEEGLPEGLPDHEPPELPERPISSPALALSIQVLRALLQEAEGGYIADRIEQLQIETNDQFDPIETEILTRAAANNLREGLPDIDYAYRFLLAYRGSIGPIDGEG